MQSQVKVRKHKNIHVPDEVYEKLLRVLIKAVVKKDKNCQWQGAYSGKTKR